MKIKKVLSFTKEELKIITDFNEKILEETCRTSAKDCGQCPFNKYCYQIVNFIETVSENGYWIPKE